MLLLMTELEDDPEWLTADENKTEEEDSNSYVAESSIDRVACALGGKAMLRPLLSACHEMLMKNEKPGQEECGNLQKMFPAGWLILKGFFSGP